MRRLNPEKLLLSKWTAVTPQHKEKHFIVVEVIRDEEQQIESCVLEAVISNNNYTLPWQQLLNGSDWQQGWK